MLSSAATIRDLQNHIAEVERRSGFLEETTMQKCLLLGEELGELFKAVRTDAGMGVDPNSPSHHVAEELADILAFVLAIANRTGVDLASAFIEKQTKNESRVWYRRGTDPSG